MMTKARRCSAVAIALAVVLASACSTNARRVDCEWRLAPINQPAPKPGKSPTASSSETRRETR
jgi:hypothetical protein